MSRFIETLAEVPQVDMRMRAGWPKPIKVSMVSTPENRFAGFLKEHKIVAHWAVTIACADDEVSGAIANARAELMEAVYGDLRRNLILLERAVMERDHEKAMDCIRDIRAEIE